MTTRVLCALFLACLALPAAAQWSTPASVASSSSQNGGEGKLWTGKPDDAAAFAKALEKHLAANRVRVAIVARAGRKAEDLPKGIAYTHTGFFVYSDITLADGRVVPGYVVYNLYQGLDGDKARSYLEQDFPINMVADMAEPYLGVIIPTPDMQNKILDVISSPRYAAMHVERYSLLANPLNAKFQNCTEFVLDVIIAGILGIDNYDAVKAYAATHFTPQTVRLGFFKSLLGPAFVKGVAVSDHNGPFRTATLGTIAQFLQEQGGLQSFYDFHVGGSVTPRPLS